MLDALERRDKFYEWRQEHWSTLGTRCFALAAFALSPLLAALFDEGVDVREWHVVMLLVAALIATLAGVAWHVGVSRLHDAYLRLEASADGAEEPSSQPVVETHPW